MRKILIFITAIFAMLYALAQRPDRLVSLPPYENPTGNEFPIMGYHTFEDFQLLTSENFKNFRDAGFNIAFSYHFWPCWLDSTFKYSNMYGLKLMLEARRGDFGGMMRFIGNMSALNPNGTPKYPNVIGFHLWDEPNVNEFAGAKCVLDSAAKRLHRDMLLDIVIFGNGMDNTNLLDLDTYKCYVNSFEVMVRPQFISFDHYGVRADSGGYGSRYLHPNYYENLEIISSLARKNDIPFWAFVLSTAHGIYPIPTRAELSLQAFSSLAYGAQGLQYYGYGHKEPSGDNNFHDSPIESDGTRTPLWYDIQAVNQQVLAMSHVFLGMEVQNVWHTKRIGSNGNSSLPIGTIDLHDTIPSHNVPPLPTAIYSVNELTNGIGVLVSYFINNDTNYLMIVNRDFEQIQQISVVTDTIVDFYRSSSSTRSRESFTELPPPLTTGRLFVKDLEPGGFYILKWD